MNTEIKRRGRPRKTAEKKEDTKEPKEPKKRGRPPKKALPFIRMDKTPKQFKKPDEQVLKEKGNTNKKLSENIDDTILSWGLDGYTEVNISNMFNILKNGDFVRYITTDNKARNGGIITSMVDNGDLKYLNLLNINNKISWSVQKYNLKKLFVKPRGKKEDKKEEVSKLEIEPIEKEKKDLVFQDNILKYI